MLEAKFADDLLSSSILGQISVGLPDTASSVPSLKKCYTFIHT